MSARRAPSPPYELEKPVAGMFGGLVQELRQHGRARFTGPELWRMASIADLTWHWKRRRLEDVDIQTLKRYRAAFGLPELPPKPAR